MITLSDEERRKVAAWLRQDADGDELMMEQMKKLNLEPLIRQKSVEVAAKRLVAKVLDSIETHTI